MSTKINDSLSFKGIDLNSISNPVEGQIARDITDSYLKVYSAEQELWTLVGNVSIPLELAGAKIIKTSTQTLPSQAPGNDTKITFDATEDYNFGNAVTWDNINNRFVFTRDAFGKFQGTVEYAVNSTGQRRAIINGLKESVDDFQKSIKGSTAQDVMNLVMVTDIS
jgi:hypothetical protein